MIFFTYVKFCQFFGPKRPKSTKRIVGFSFVGKHLHTYQISETPSNGLDFFIFLSILAVFGQKYQNRKLSSVKNFHLIGSNYRVFKIFYYPSAGLTTNYAT